MRRARRFFLFGLMAVLTSQPWPAMAQRADLSGFPDELQLGQHGLVRRWFGQMPAISPREIVTTLKVSDGLLFAQTSKGRIFCLESESGSLRWQAVVGDATSEVYPPAISGESIFVASADKLVHIDRTTGQVQWVRELPSAAASGPGANADYVYVPTMQNRIYAIALNDDLGRKLTVRPIAWYYQADGTLENPPIVLRDRVAFLSGSGTLYTTHLNERQLYFRFYTYTKNAAPLASLDRLLYVATTDYNLFAVDLITGRARWRFPASFPIARKPIPFADDVFVTPKGAGLYCLSNDNGKVHWYNQRVTRVNAVSQEYVYGADDVNNFYVLARADGRVRATWPMRAFSVLCENQFTDRIFIGTTEGLVVCLHEKTNRKPFLHPQVVQPPKMAVEPEPKESTAPSAKSKKERRAFFEGIEDLDKASKKAESKPADEKPKGGGVRGFFDAIRKGAEKKSP